MSESQSPELEGRQRRVERLRMEGKLSVPLPSMEAYQMWVLESQQGMKYVLGSLRILSLIVDRCRNEAIRVQDNM